jgi:hypothetical protein
MRSRTSRTAVLSGLVGLLLFLVACAGPAPSTDPPSADRTASATAGSDPGGGGGGPVKPRPSHTRITKPTTPRTTPPKTSPPKTSPPKTSPPVKAAMGKFSVPGYAVSSVAPDGRTATVTFAGLEAENGRESRTATIKLPLTGDTSHAVLEFSASGYAFTTRSADANLSMTVCGRKTGRTFGPGSDDDYVQTLSVGLRGARTCTITLTVQARPDTGIRDTAAAIDVLSLDAQFL